LNINNLSFDSNKNKSKSKQAKIQLLKDKIRMNNVINCLAILVSIISVTHSQYFQVARNDADLAAAINNRGYTATIVDYMTTTCSRSRYMKVFFISNFSSLNVVLCR
jgi:hypothetical protein